MPESQADRPVQGGWEGRIYLPPGRIPDAVGRLAYEEYARLYGEHPGGGYERLMERGGFSWGELADFLSATLTRKRGERTNA